MVATIITDLLKEQGIVPDYTAGLSLGEYSALYCAGVFKRQQVIDLARFRGKVMQEAVSGIESEMIAVLGMKEELLQDLRGSVWKCVAYDKKEVEMLNHKYCIINIHQENNTTELRIVSRQKPTVNAVNIEPNLEDLYLAYFQDNEK